MNKLFRSVGIMSAAMAFGAGSAVVAPLAGAQGVNCVEPTVTTVTPSTLAAEGWSTPSDETAATIAAVENAPERVGAAALTFSDTDDGASLYKNADRMALEDLMEGEEVVDLSYDYVSDGQAPALQIRLEGADLADSESESAGYDIGFATIVHSPEDSNGVWMTADPGEASEFWVTRALKGEDGEVIPRGTMMTFEEILELNWPAVVTEYGVQQTRDNDAANVAVDNFTVACEIANFELDSDDGDDNGDDDGDEDGDDNGDGDGSTGSLSGIFGSVTGSLGS